MDLYSLENPSFLNLLAATQSTQFIESEYTEVTRHSSQGSEAPSAKERRSWSPKEDKVLISAWLNTSKDPIVGNEQKAAAFWKRILEYYNASPALAGIPPREANQCKQRWFRINSEVNKFVGCYEAARKEQTSGQNEDDVIKRAEEIFFNDKNSKFTLDHAWRELRHDQKWCSMVEGKESVKEKRKCNGVQEGAEEVSESRPPGVKACKAAKRKKNGKEQALDKFENMLDKKDKLNKQRLLASLLAKTEPLSDIEVALKNKLINEML